MTKEMYLDIIKFIIMFVLLTNLVLVSQIIYYLNLKVQYQTDIYLGEFNKMQVSMEKIGVTVIEEHTLVKFEEVLIEEFEVSDNISLSDELQEFLWYICKMYNIDYHLVLAIIDVESGFNTDVINYGNYGLMQINEVNHKWLQDELLIGSDFLNPYNNLLSGCYFLSLIANKYDSYNEILMVYNIGESGANKLFQQNIYSTSYTNKVKEKYEFYGGVEYIE